MTTREYADKLRQVADYLDAHPEFETPAYGEVLPLSFQYFSDKDRFIAGVRALGTGKKAIGGVSNDDLTFTSGPIVLVVNRDKVCRKVQEEKWECEPLLSPDEEALVVGNGN